jgi:ATP-binding cassette, subfamily B (MDR/TAP), member 1
MFSVYLQQDLSFFDRPENTIGALTSRVDSTAQSLFELMGFNISMVLLSIFNVIACSALSVAVSWKLGLVGVFAGIPPMILGGYIRFRVETKLDADIDAKLLKSVSVASESVTAIRTVSSLAIENDVLRRYTNELDEAIEESKFPLVTMMAFFAFTQSVEFFVLALGFW